MIKKNLGKFFKEKFPHSDNDEKPQAKSGQNYLAENGNKFAFGCFSLNLAISLLNTMVSGNN